MKTVKPVKFVKLYKEMEMQNLRVSTLAKKTKINECTLWSRLRGETVWLSTEIVRICDVLKINCAKFKEYFC